MTDEIRHLPDGVMKEIKGILKRLITTNPTEAYNYLRNDPLAAIALPSVKKALIKTPAGTSVEFFDEYDKIVNDLFIPVSMIHEYGLAFTVELLAEKWREYNQNQDFDAYTSIILAGLQYTETLLKNVTNDLQGKIIQGMILENMARITETREYERYKGNEVLDKFSDDLQRFADKTIRNYIKNPVLNFFQLEGLIKIATLSDVFAESFRQEFAKILVNIFKEHFEEFEEKDKFKIAPFMLLLRKYANQETVQ